jgi:alpha-glucosidase (family GH31 glycosyl hydrolase)
MHARIAVGVALAVLTSASAAAAQTPRLGWSVEADPFRLTYKVGERPLAAQQLGEAGPGARLSYELDDGSRHTLTRLLRRTRRRNATAYRVATDQPGREATVTVTRTRRGLRVKTALDGPPARRVYEALTASPTDHFLGSGARHRYVDLAGQVTELKAQFVPAYFTQFCNTTAVPVPFFMSSAGFGVRVASTAIGRLAFPGAQEDEQDDQCFRDEDLCPISEGRPDRVQICLEGSSLKYELYAGSPTRLTRAWSSAIGRPLLPPPAQFGFVKWREAVAGPDELLDDIDQLKRRGIPLTSVLLDNPWETDGARGDLTGSACVGSLQFDQDAFPDPKAMIEAVHARGVRFMLWVAPFVRDPEGTTCPAHGYPPGSFVEGENFAERLPSPLQGFSAPPPLDIDLTNPAAVRHFEARLRSVFALGVDAIKGDRGDETDFERSRFHAGSGRLWHNRYPVLYARAAMRALRASARVRGADPARVFSIFRAGSVGSQSATPGMWAGDQEMTVEGMRQAIRLGLSTSVSGLPVWGSDVGGYLGKVSDLAADPAGAPTSEDLLPSAGTLVRWSQLGAVSPVMELGGRGLQQRFWENYEQPVVDAIRDAVVLHYELFPHHYQLARRAARTGVPILRPLGYADPADEEGWAHELEFFVGSNLLAAPIADPAAETTDTHAGRSLANVYLPAGRWVDLFTSETHEGPTTLMRDTPLGEFPLYLREGAAIPFNAREPAVFRRPWRLSELRNTRRAGWLYAPGAAARIATTDQGAFRARRTGTRITIQLKKAPRQAQVLVLGALPQSVRVDGRRAPRLGEDEIRRVSAGWTPREGSLAGAMLKLAPRRGRVRVELRY